MEAEEMGRRPSLLQRFNIQLCSKRPEKFQLDFMVHIVIVLLLTVYYGYFSMQMDDDPLICFAT